MVFKHYTVMTFYILTVQIIKLLSGKYSFQCINVFHNNPTSATKGRKEGYQPARVSDLPLGMCTPC